VREISKTLLGSSLGLCIENWLWRLAKPLEVNWDVAKKQMILVLFLVSICYIIICFNVASLHRKFLSIETSEWAEKPFWLFLTQIFLSISYLILDLRNAENYYYYYYYYRRSVARWSNFVAKIVPKELHQ